MPLTPEDRDDLARFAAAALPLAARWVEVFSGQPTRSNWDAAYGEIAKRALALADAMLAELRKRERSQP